ncbi:PLxRFG protein [Klebsiella phage vB_KpnP_ZX1]|nr:PLxRFG protein [Klebsiella phage vB_KpnP_ZX1]
MAKNSLPSELDLVQQPSYGLPDWAQRPQAQTVNTGGAVPFQAEFLSASQKYGVPFNVLMGLAEQESSFNPTAIGVPTKYGRAKGLMQYIDDTASRMGINPYDPVQSIDAAARQLRERLDKGYSMQEAVQAHFGGDDRKQWGPKTAQYGKDVLGRAEKFLGGGQSVAAGQPTQQQEQPQTRMGQIAQDYPPAQSAMENLDQTRQRTQALLDEMNKEEPGRYRPLTDEEMQRLSQHITPEMQQQAMQSGKPIEINIPDLVQPGQAVTAQQSVTQQPQKQPEGNKDGNLFTDALALLDSGFNTAAKDVQELVGKIPYIGKPIVDAADRFDRWANGKSSQELFKAYDESVERRLSPEMLAARRKSFVIEPGDDLGDGKKSTGYNFGPAWSDPRAYMSGILESLPEMALTMGGSGRLAQMAYRRALASGASREVAAKAAARTATVAGGILEGSLGGAQSSRQVREDILKMKPEQLANSDAMKSLMDGGLSFEQARAQLAENASSQAFMLAGISTGIFGGMGDRALAKIITNRAGGRLKAAMAGAIGEGVFEEMPQSATQQMSQNYAMQQADPNTPLMKGVANQAAGGLAVGGLMGAGMGAAAPRVSESNPADQTQEDSGSSIPTVKFEDNGPPPGYTGEWRDGGPVITITEGNGQSSTEQPQEVKPSGPLGRALQAGVQQTTEDVAAQAQQNTAAAENHTPDEFMGPVGAETMVIPSDDPESAFPAVVQEYRNGNAVVADQNGEILEFGPHEVVRPDAAADIAQQQPAQAVNEPAQQAEQATEEQPRQPKAVSEMTEPELRDRLKYLHQQAKSSGGWNERLTKARREVEKAIDAKNAPVQGEIDTEAVQANGLTPSENRRLKELLNKDSRTQAESAEATRLNEKSRASLTEEVPQSTSENTVGAEGMTLVHGSGNGNLTLDDIQIVRANGQKQGKKGRVYGGFYGTSEKDSAQAEGYAGMMEGTPTVYDVKIKPGTKVFQKEGDITRLSENTINDLVSKGYGVVVGTDPRGRTEYAVIDKNAIQQLSKRGVANAETTNVSDERSAQPEVSQVAQPDNAPAVQPDESGTAAQLDRVAPATSEPGAGRQSDVLPVSGPTNADPTLNKDGSQKWFGTERKANEYLQKKGITGTHEIRLVDRRFEIHAKGHDGALTNEGTTEKAAPSKGKNGPRYNRVKKLLGAEEGDIVTPQEDIGYATAGRQYRIDQIEKNGIVHLTNLETNGGTTVSLGELERAKSRKSGFNRVEAVAETAPTTQERQQPAQEWQAFDSESGTLGIPRAEMPQVKAEHRGPMVNFLAARGITHREGMVPADTLKPTQAEFSPERVARARESNSDRSILVSSDGYVLDGHHQWLAAREKGDNVKAIVLDAPIRDLLPLVHEFPSSLVDTSSAPETAKTEPETAESAPNPTESATDAAKSATQQTSTPEYGASNKLVSQDRAAELRKKLKAKFSQLNSGLDPEILAIGTELAVFHIEAGVRKFADFARAMSADLDVPISRLRPYLRGWFNGARDIMEDSGISIEGMDSHETVRAELAKLDQAPVKEEAPAQTAPKAENQAPVNQPAPASQARTTSALDDMVAQFDNEVTPNVSGTRSGMEPDSRNAADAVSGNESTVLDGSGRNNRSNEQPGQRPESERSAGQRNQRVSEDGAASRREPGNQQIHQPDGQFESEGRAAGGTERSGSRSDSPARSPVEQQRRRAIVDNAHAAGAGDLDSRLKAQKAAKGAPTTWADKASIDAALPLLLPEQRGDVLKIEQRHQVATGVLSTNGTGTGKTATGLGAAKRYYNAGKKNIAIVVPTDKVASDWVKFAGMMDMPLRQLSGIDDAGGSGPIVTTYANFGQNDALYSRQWDLIIPDESHYLSSNANGDSTAALDKLRGLTGHPEGFQHWLIGNNRELSDQLNEQRAILNKMNSSQAGYQAQEQKVNRLTEQWQAIEQPARREWQQRWTEQRDLPKVVFLSATPFAYVKNTDYAEGYLFHHTPPAERYTENSTGGYNSANDRERFYMEHFGYRMRYNKLTQPEAGVNTELMEQNFNQWLKDTGALFGRRLDVPFDYDRRFQLIDDAAGKKLDDALRFLNEAENGIYRPIYDEVMRTFDYQRRMFLLESMKARAAVPVIREHLKLGRKVVVFHDYNQGGGFSPFSEALAEMKDLDMRSTASELFQRPMFRINFSGLDSAINTIKKAFPNVLLFNGTVSKGKRRQNADFFNADNSGKNLILVQSDAGREGVSLHDTTGKHQRVEINLGMPTRPVAATQIEGRIYRTGQASDAIFRYMTTGTSWEASTFASKIAERAATAENLALGEEARGLKQSFIDAYNEAEPMQASREDGKGGKERDQALSQNITPFDKAKTFYWAQQKNTKRRDQREGQDYFATPEPVGLKMVEWANIKPGDKVLEPSAGHGAIARFFPAQSDVTMVEPSYDLSQRAALANGTARIINGRFEDLSRANKFDAIVMNPPFGTGGKTAYEHLAKAAKHLRQGGRLVALVPRGGISERRFDQFFGGDEAKGLDLVARIKMPWVTFERAGTKVATEVLVFERHDKSDGSIIPVRPDLSSAQTINELFDRIEGLTLPERQPLTADEAIANAADGTMYSVPQVQQQTAREFAASLREENPGLKIDLVGSGKVVTLSRIVVPDDARNSGTGTAVMQRLTQWADQNGKTLALSPSGDFGGNKARLSDFYKRFGFVENKGRAKDYEISETMYREPQETRMSVTADPGTVTRGETGELAQQLLDSGRLELHSAPPAPEYAAAGGWIDPDGKIHLALYNLRPEDVQPTLMHELFHAGMRNIGGDRRWVNLIDRLGQYYRAAQNGGAKNEWTAAVERIQNAQRQGDRMNDAARDHVIEELGAYAVENFEKMPAGIRKWAESIIGTVKNYLQQTFGLQLGKVTPGQLRALAAGAIRNQKAPATSTSFSTPESSQPPKAEEKQSWFNQRWDEVADLPDNMLKTVMPALLRFTPGRFILKRVGKDIPALGRYADVKLQMDTLRDEWHAKTDQESQKWLKYRVSKPQENAELMGLMHDSTLAQVDPSKDFQSILNAIDLTALREKKRGDPAWDEANQKAQDDAKRKEEHGKLRERYNALSPEGKQIYNRVRDLYSRLADAQEQAIIDNMEKAMDIRSRQVRRKFEDEMQRITDEGLKGKDKEDAIAAAKKALNNGLRKDAWNRRARINQLRSEFESNRLAGPYFPLARFGDFFVTARKKGSGEVVSFSRTETAFAQTRLRKQLEKEGYDVETGIVSKSNDLRKQVPADFVARIEDLLKGIEGTQQTQDQVWQLYLQTMPDYSLRKSRIHRKGRAGFEEDALRAFASHMFHGSHQLARMKYSMELGDLIDQAEREAKRTRSPVRSGLVVEQARMNHDYVMNPTSNRISQVATQGAFMWYLAQSPAAALVNMSQTFIVAPAKLAAFYDKGAAAGIPVALGYLNRAMFDLGMGRTFAEKSARVTPEEKRAVSEAYRMGLITRTQSHDVAGIGDSGVKYSPIRAKLMAALSFMFHHTERINREATFLAAYRMAKKRGLDPKNAIRKAADLTWDSHYDYQNSSRPAIMHSNVGKTLLVFRNYSLNMLADLAYTAYEMINPRNKQERREARTQMLGLGATLAFNAGIRGLPLYGLLMAIAGMFSDDDEDPEVELKKTMLQYFPKQMVGIMMDGVPGYLSGVELSGRIGFGDLWFRSDDMDREGDSQFLYWAMQVLGASTGIPYNWYRGVSQINDGYTWRGIETMVPKAIKDPMKAWRYYSEGVTTKNGDPIVDDLDGWNIFKQAMGFTPAKVTEQYKMNSYNMNKQTAITEERSKLLGDFYKAWKAGDEKKVDQITDKMREYSEKYPEMRIDGDAVRSSLTRREKYRGSALGGMNYNQKLVPRLQEEQPGTVYR